MTVLDQIRDRSGCMLHRGELLRQVAAECVAAQCNDNFLSIHTAFSSPSGCRIRI